MSSERQELIRRFAVAIAGGYFANANERWQMNAQKVWEEAAKLAGAEPQPNKQAQQPEHTQEETKDVERLFGLAETLAGRIRRAAALLRGAIRYHTAAGFVLTEDTVDEAVQILEGNSDD